MTPQYLPHAPYALPSDASSSTVIVFFLHLAHWDLFSPSLFVQSQGTLLWPLALLNIVFFHILVSMKLGCPLLALLCQCLNERGKEHYTLATISEVLVSYFSSRQVTRRYFAPELSQLGP